MLLAQGSLEPGQVDFRKARWAPVVNCVVSYRGKILLVKRNPKLHFYPGYWNGISGFLDDKKSLKEKVQEELREELNMSKNAIISIRLGTIFDQEEPTYKKTWIVHPVLVKVRSGTVRLDWEATEYQWVTPKDALKLKLLPGFKEVLKVLELV